MSSRLPCTLIVLSACASSPTPQTDHASPDIAPTHGDVLWVGPTFITTLGDATALRVAPDGRITAIYRADEPLPDLDRVLLDGAFATPGLIDSHLHLTWLGRVDDQLDLSDATSAADVAQRVTRFARAHPYLAVITGFGWDQTRWGSAPQGAALPNAADLPDVSVPIILSRVDGHALWLDRRALALVDDLLGLDDPGFRVLRDATSPTGVLIDPPAQIRARLLPAPTPQDLARHLGRGLDKARRAGLVEVHDMATTVAELKAMAALPHPLAARVVVYLDDSDASFAYLTARGQPGPHAVTPDVWVAGVKLFADGALGSRGAALKADYSDETGHRGQLADPVDLTAKAVRAAELGYPVAIHAIGDHANHVALGIIDTASRATSHRLVARIEHAQILDFADLDHFRDTRTVASMQPTHAISDMRWAESRLGTRITNAYAWRTIKAHGIPLAFGSDAPVEPIDPCLGLHAATTRRDADDQPPGGWYASETLPWSAALEAFTEGGVHAAPLALQGRTGRLDIGSRAELTLFTTDPRQTPFNRTRVVGTRR